MLDYATFTSRWAVATEPVGNESAEVAELLGRMRVVVDALADRLSEEDRPLLAAVQSCWWDAFSGFGLFNAWLGAGLQASPDWDPEAVARRVRDRYDCVHLPRLAQDEWAPPAQAM